MMSPRLREYIKVILVLSAIVYVVIFTSQYVIKSLRRPIVVKSSKSLSKEQLITIGIPRAVPTVSVNRRLSVTTMVKPWVITNKVEGGKLSSLKKAAGGYNNQMKLDMNIPVEIINCANKTVTNPYKYDYSTEFYLPPPVQDLCRMSLPDLEYLYQRYLSSIQTVCKNPRRFGKITDGGWDVCVEPKYLQINSCLVYSFGINNDFSFDDDIADSFHCEVHSFDPSMGAKSHVRSKDRTYFHATGLSDVTRTNVVGNEWRMQTLQDIRTELNHVERMPDVVKMDIEAWEWNVLPEMFASGHFPRQLIIEFHLWSQRYTTQKDMWIRRLAILRDIYDAGYRIFWMNRNLVCKYKSLYTFKPTLACHEISLLRNGPNVLTGSNT